MTDQGYASPPEKDLMSEEEEIDEDLDTQAPDEQEGLPLGYSQDEDDEEEEEPVNSQTLLSTVEDVRMEVKEVSKSIIKLMEAFEELKKRTLEPKERTLKQIIKKSVKRIKSGEDPRRVMSDIESDKPYQCKYCAKGFAYPQTAKYHEMTSCKVRPTGNGLISGKGVYGKGIHQRR